MIASASRLKAEYMRSAEVSERLSRRTVMSVDLSSDLCATTAETPTSDASV